MRRKVALALLLTVLAACNRLGQTRHSFYYWKLERSYPDSNEANLINKLGVEHFYIHFFDVDWSEMRKIPVPTGTLYAYALDSFAKSYTPVVFITNRTFQNISSGWCDTLAQKIAFKINDIAGSLITEQYMAASTILDSMHVRWNDTTINYGKKHDSVEKALVQKMRDRIHDVQIDCDWTAGTKEKYFLFLKKLKEHMPGKKVSVTVRLYPYKYRTKTGIPPADEAVLMCYNMGNINLPQTRNSVFDIDELKKYLVDSDYPIPLEIALPIFGWHVWFRGGDYKGIVYGGQELTGLPAFRKQDNNNYVLTKDTVVQNKYLREGDILRTEYPDSTELINAAKLIAKKKPGNNGFVFYHWDKKTVQQYEQTISKIFSDH